MWIAKYKFFISYQNRQGFKITCKEWNTCLLIYFRKMRSRNTLRKIAPRSEDQGAKEFGYNENTTRIQRNVSNTSGNTRGRFDRKRPWDNVTDDKVQKKNSERKYKCNNAITQFASFSIFLFFFINRQDTCITLILL